MTPHSRNCMNFKLVGQADLDLFPRSSNVSAGGGGT